MNSAYHIFPEFNTACSNSFLSNQQSNLLAVYCTIAWGKFPLRDNKVFLNLFSSARFSFIFASAIISFKLLMYFTSLYTLADIEII